MNGDGSPSIGPDEMPGWLINQDILGSGSPGHLVLTEFGHNLTHVLVEIHDAYLPDKIKGSRR